MEGEMRATDTELPDGYRRADGGDGVGWEVLKVEGGTNGEPSWVYICE